MTTGDIALILWTIASFRIVFIVFRLWYKVGLDAELPDAYTR